MWRLGKKMLGYYQIFRFGWGSPFHARVPRKRIEVGLKAVAGLMAK